MRILRTVLRHFKRPCVLTLALLYLCQPGYSSNPRRLRNPADPQNYSEKHRHSVPQAEAETSPDKSSKLNLDGWVRNKNLQSPATEVLWMSVVKY